MATTCEACGGSLEDMPGATTCSAQCAEAAHQQALYEEGK